MEKINSKEISKMSFEEAFARLEELINVLETGEEKLDHVVDLYEMGVALTTHCKKKLDNAKMRIDAIGKNEAGELAVIENKTEEFCGN